MANKEKVTRERKRSQLERQRNRNEDQVVRANELEYSIFIAEALEVGGMF